MAIEITVDNSDVLRRLNRAQDEVTHMLRAPMERSLDVLHDDIAVAPALRPNQRYIRGKGTPNAAGIVTRLTSQNLTKKWTTRITEGGGVIRGELGNNATYGPYVQDAELQAWMHRGRWATTNEVAEENEGNIQGFFQDAINEFIESLGG